MSGVPKEIDETAYIDGYSFPKFFVKIFVPLIGSDAYHRGAWKTRKKPRWAKLFE